MGQVFATLVVTWTIGALGATRVVYKTWIVPFFVVSHHSLEIGIVCMQGWLAWQLLAGVLVRAACSLCHVLPHYHNPHRRVHMCAKCGDWMHCAASLLLYPLAIAIVVVWNNISGGKF